MELILGCACVLFLLFLGLFAGSFNERRHFRSLDERETRLGYIGVSDIRQYVGGAHPRASGTLVVAEVVVGTDYFKNFLATFRKIVGGELTSYHSLMSRARREALVRIKEQAAAGGYNAICNLRMETMDMSMLSPKQQAAMVAVVAYGTAYRIPHPDM